MSDPVVTMLNPDDPGCGERNSEWLQARHADARHLALLALTGCTYDDFDIDEGGMAP
jgi:hypothetical protein